jgi:hypothetical protein
VVGEISKYKQWRKHTCLHHCMAARTRGQTVVVEQVPMGRLSLLLAARVVKAMGMIECMLLITHPWMFTSELRA